MKILYYENINLILYFISVHACAYVLNGYSHKRVVHTMVYTMVIRMYVHKTGHETGACVLLHDAHY